MDWFQPDTSTFSTLSIIIWYHKTGRQISQPYFNCFQKSNIPSKKLLVEPCIGIFFIYLPSIVPLQKACPYLFLFFLLFSHISIFHFYISKELRIWKNTVCRPLSNLGSIKNTINIIFFVLSNNIFKILSKSHNLHIWQKITNFIMANRIGGVHKLGKQKIK